MPTELHLPLLDRVRIASPCPVKWEDMTGDDTTRHCAQCNLSVFNLSNMSREEAESLLQKKIDDPTMRLCASIFRRADGTILLKDCPVGLRAIRLRVFQIVGRIAAAVGLLTVGSYCIAQSQREDWQAWGWSMKLRNLQPFRAVIDRLHPQTYGGGLSGEVCLPPAPPPLANQPDQFGPHPTF